MQVQSGFLKKAGLLTPYNFLFPNAQYFKTGLKKKIRKAKHIQFLYYKEKPFQNNVVPFCDSKLILSGLYITPYEWMPRISLTRNAGVTRIILPRRQSAKYASG